MDAWTFVFDLWRRFGTERVLHATAHDGLMATPGLGDYFRVAGVIPASRQGVSAALSAGRDVIIWREATSQGLKRSFAARGCRSCSASPSA
jgi:hypothetical protein